MMAEEHQDHRNYEDDPDYDEQTNYSLKKYKICRECGNKIWLNHPYKLIGAHVCMGGIEDEAM